MGSVTSLLAERVTLRLSSVDRVFVAGYVPQLQTEGQVVRFLLNRGYKIPSRPGWVTTMTGSSARSTGSSRQVMCRW